MTTSTVTAPTRVGLAARLPRAPAPHCRASEQELEEQGGLVHRRAGRSPRPDGRRGAICGVGLLSVGVLVVGPAVARVLLGGHPSGSSGSIGRLVGCGLELGELLDLVRRRQAQARVERVRSAPRGGRLLLLLLLRTVAVTGLKAPKMASQPENERGLVAGADGDLEGGALEVAELVEAVDGARRCR